MNREPLSAAERLWIRMEIDKRKRRRFGGHVTTSCGGCGMPLDDLTPGCAPCNDRHRSRARRGADTAKAAESRRLLALVKPTIDQLHADKSSAHLTAYNAARRAEGRA